MANAALYDREMYIRSAIGTRLWAASVGRGPGVVLCDGLGCDGYVWKYVLPDLSRDCQVIRWHYRGHGLSEAPDSLDAMNIEGLTLDLGVMLDEMGLKEPVVLVGHSMGVQVVLEAALRYGSRVAGVVALCGAAGRPLDTFKNTRLGLTVLPIVQDAVRRYPALSAGLWGGLVPSAPALALVKAFEINSSLLNVEEMRPYLERLAEMDPRVFLSMLEHASQHSAQERLHELAGLPALVVAAQRDTFTPMQRSVAIHDALPGSEFFMLPEATHTGPLEWPELLNLRIRKWMHDHGILPPIGRLAG
jgi:pimeloyl-ACP methyl ester carboxylesterase